MSIRPPEDPSTPPPPPDLPDRTSRSCWSQSSIIARNVKFGTTCERFNRRFVDGSTCWWSSHCINADRSYVIPAGVTAGSRITQRVMGHLK